MAIETKSVHCANPLRIDRQEPPPPLISGCRNTYISYSPPTPCNHDERFCPPSLKRISLHFTVTRYSSACPGPSTNTKALLNCNSRRDGGFWMDRWFHINSTSSTVQIRTNSVSCLALMKRPSPQDSKLSCGTAPLSAHYFHKSQDAVCTSMSYYLSKRIQPPNVVCMFTWSQIKEEVE